MEWVTGFFGGLALGAITWPVWALIALVIIGVLFEHNEAQTGAVLCVLGIFGIAYMITDVDFSIILLLSAAYVAVGFVWSIYRYWRWLREKTKTIQESDNIPGIKSSRIADLHYTKNIDTITAWVVTWPLSAVDNLAGDIIDSIKTLINTVFSRLFQAIFDKVTGSVQ